MINFMRWNISQSIWQIEIFFFLMAILPYCKICKLFSCNFNFVFFQFALIHNFLFKTKKWFCWIQHGKLLFTQIWFLPFFWYMTFICSESVLQIFKEWNKDEEGNPQTPWASAMKTPWASSADTQKCLKF